MPPPAGQRKNYEQPYSSKHVQANTNDPLRYADPYYIKIFPKYLNAVYRRQQPFNARFYKRTAASYNADPSTSENSHSPDNAMESSETRSPSSPQTNIKNTANTPQHGLKTIGGQSNSRSPSTSANQLSNMPSDFEHIFHYSEAPQ